MMLCKYKDVFGKPREGLHKYRLFDVAVIDVVGTFVGALVISQVSGLRFISVFIGLMGLGVLAHRVFCVNTKLNILLFGRV